ncbi:MAG: SGNH/GDSL hydrolase family protein [Candidatus Omnitrophica bacterium]|nr:SGNH/GDSL hydrolase family protein [Candidatus Omnitrophota bacterium]
MKKIIAILSIFGIASCGILAYIKTQSFIGVLIYEALLLFFTEIVLRVFIVAELKLGWKGRITSRLRQNFKEPKMLAFQEHPYALYVKTPNSEGLYPSNNMGYVGKRPISVEKPGNIIRIYSIGGSTIAMVDPAQGPNSHWPAKMQDLLNKKLGNNIVEVVNAGSSAYTTAESFSEFVFRGIDLKADILLIHSNVNDAWTAQMIDGFKSDYSHVRVQKPWKLNRVYSLPNLNFLISYQLIRHEIIERFGKSNTLIHQISNPRWKSTQNFTGERVRIFKRNIRNTIAVAQINSVKPIIIRWEFDWDSGWVPPYLDGSPKDALARKFIQYAKANNDALEELAEECNIPLIELGDFRSDCFSDHIHFNAKGLNEIAYRVSCNIYPFIEQLIEKNERVHYTSKKP